MSMAQYVKFVAMHGLYRPPETSIQSKEEDAKEKSKQATKRRNDYEKFWEEKYAQISDKAAIMNFEYVLEQIDNWGYNIRFGHKYNVNLQYPAAHADALIRTHPEVIRKRINELIRFAYPPGWQWGRIPENDKEYRLCRLGQACNSYKNTGFWW